MVLLEALHGILLRNGWDIGGIASLGGSFMEQ